MTQQPIPLRDQRWPVGTPPVVSIFCLTYNHEKFIRDAIEGFLMQETTFPVQIYIHDDASSDGTAVILKEYQQAFPNLFKLEIQKTNQWQKRGGYHFFEILSQREGRYLALCEGDDYWTDPKKLQTQHDFLERHPEHSAHSHRVKVGGDSSRFGSDRWPKLEQEKNFAKPIELEENIIPTCSLFARSVCLKDPSMAKGLRSIIGDWLILIRLLEHGAIHFSPNCMGVYRIHAAGAWQAKEYWKQVEEITGFFRHVLRRASLPAKKLALRKIHQGNKFLTGHYAGQGQIHRTLAAGLTALLLEVLQKPGQFIGELKNVARQLRRAWRIQKVKRGKVP